MGQLSPGETATMETAETESWVDQIRRSAPQAARRPAPAAPAPCACGPVAVAAPVAR